MLLLSHHRAGLMRRETLTQFAASEAFFGPEQHRLLFRCCRPRTGGYVHYQRGGVLHLMLMMQACDQA